MGYDFSGEYRDADTVFVVGATTPWYPPSSFPGDDTKIIYLDETPLRERLPFWGYRANWMLTADVSPCLTHLLRIVRTKINETGTTGSLYKRRFEQLQSNHNRMTEKWKNQAEGEKANTPISPRWFFHTLNELLPARSIVLEETITHTPFINQYLTKPDRIIRACYGGLGMGLGEAAGTKIVSAGSPVLFIVGDGTFHYNPVPAGLGFLQEYKLPVLIIILNNSGYVSMRRGYHRSFPEGWAASHKKYLGVNIAPSPDYSKMAETYGAYGERIEVPEDIEAAVNRALKEILSERTALLDVIIDTP
jgi:acetolactate synthase-1/2/3 large subunit